MFGPDCHRLTAMICAAVALAASACDAPSTTVALDNDYPGGARPLVVYDAFWSAVEFGQPSGAAPTQQPIAPGASSDPQPTVACSPNTAYVLIAPGWDPASGATPAAFILLQSRDGLPVQLNDELRIAVDDAHFAGNCAAGSPLAQAQADGLAELVFAGDLGGRGYDAATCSVREGP